METYDIHIRKASDRDIRTWKNNFVSGLNGNDKRLPIHLWDRLLYQAQIPLNMLRLSRLTPKISAHAMIENNLDFKKTSLAPPGRKVIFHEKSNRRCTWGHNGVHGWYLGPAVEHYRCYKVYISNTRAELITNTVELFLDNTTIPGIYSTNAANHSATDLIITLKIQHQMPHFHP